MLVGIPPFPIDNKPESIEKVKAGIKEYPETVDRVSRSLIKRLTCTNPAKRLGAKDIQEIFNHKWFAGINWVALLLKKETPPVIPKYLHPGDTSNFDYYSENDENIGEISPSNCKKDTAFPFI